MNYNLEFAPKSTEVILPWEDAILYCTGLEVDGKSDWRLPTISEMKLLRETYLAEVRLDGVLSEAYMAGIIETPEYWSSEIEMIEFDDDDEDCDGWVSTYDYLSSYTDSAGPDCKLSVRAVRIIKPFDSIPVKQAPDSCIIMTTLEEAQLYCFSLNLDGKIGWRFPTLEECYHFNLSHQDYWHLNDIGTSVDQKYLIFPVRDIK